MAKKTVTFNERTTANLEEFEQEFFMSTDDIIKNSLAFYLFVMRRLKAAPNRTFAIIKDGAVIEAVVPLPGFRE